jgi:DHA1 family tetracycline resistance protein-like MFS transporter
MTTSSPAPAPSRHALTFVFLTVLIDSIGFGITVPVMPQLIVGLDGGGLDEAVVTAGWLLAVYAVMQVFFGPLMGNLSDRFGRRPVLLLSLAAFGVDYLLMAFAPSLVWLFIGRAVAGMAGAIYGPANAFIADITPPEKRARNFGLIGAAFGAGFILGPALGGLLAEFGPRAPFFAAAALALVNTVYGFIVLPETLPPERRRTFSWRRANPLGALKSVGRVRASAMLVAALFLWMLAGQVYPATWSFFAAIRFGWSPAEIGLSLAFVGATMIIVQVFVVGRAVEVLGERRAILVGMGSGALAFMGCALATSGWMVYPVFLISALSGLAYPALNAILSSTTPEDEQGELQGALAAVASLGEIIGPLLMAQTLGFFSSPATPVYFPGAAFVVATGLTLGAIAIVLFRTRDAKPT